MDSILGILGSGGAGSLISGILGSVLGGGQGNPLGELLGSGSGGGSSSEGDSISTAGGALSAVMDVAQIAALFA